MKNLDPVTVYLDWLNNYLTLSKMAQDYGMRAADLDDIISRGRKINRGQKT